MILVDANLLIYSHVELFKQHEVARVWLDRHLNGPIPVGLPWASLLAFLRVVTNPRVFGRPETIVEAWKQVRAWLECDPVWIPEPTERHVDLLGELLLQSGAHANLVPDAHLAALALEHGLTLCSTDSDFSKFQKLKWLNPLTS